VAGEEAAEIGIVRNGYEAWNAGDLERFIELMHPQVVWEPAGVFPGLGHSYVGREGMREFWSDFKGPWERIEIEIQEVRVIEEGSVLCRLLFRARGREGIEVERPFTNHLLVRDGMLKHFQGYTDWDEALTELGVPQE
jgi:uncharacterized protein (TIGR02246 family)